MIYPIHHILGSQRNGLNHVSMNMGGSTGRRDPSEIPITRSIPTSY